MRGCDYSVRPAKGVVAAFCERGNESFGVIKRGQFLTSSITVSLSRRTLTQWELVKTKYNEASPMPVLASSVLKDSDD